MELLIMRHGLAVDVGTEGVSNDDDRFLSAEGKTEMQGVGRALAALGALPDKAFCSPLQRAQETAMISLQAAGCDCPIEMSPGMKPGATPMSIVGLITSRASGADCVMLVGHQPDMGRFMGSLIGHESLNLNFTPGTVARVDVHEPSAGWVGRLIWIFSPDTVEKLGHG